MTEREISRNAARRLAIIRHVQEVTGNVAFTCRYYGMARPSYYKWLRRYEELGEEGLRDRSRRPLVSPHATKAAVMDRIIYLRQNYHFGPFKIAMYLKRYHDISVSQSGVWRILRRLDLSRLPTSQRYKRHKERWKRYEKQRPGHSVQIDAVLPCRFLSNLPDPQVPRPRHRHDGSLVVRDVNKALAGVTFARGYHAELLGEFTERQAAQDRLFGIAIIADAVVFLLLQTAFGSWRLAALVFITLTMAFVGGVLAAFAAGAVISIGSLLGFFTVFGIAARNGILLINHCQHLERFEGESFGAAIVLRGARERLAPILMTSLATGLAVVPLVVLGDRPGHEIEYPLAIVILGGLVTSTLLNLFVVPSLYLRFGRSRGNLARERLAAQP